MLVKCMTTNCRFFDKTMRADIIKTCCDGCGNNIKILSSEDAYKHRLAMIDRARRFRENGWIETTKAEYES